MNARKIIGQAVILITTVSLSGATPESDCTVGSGWVEHLEIGMMVDDLYEAYGEANIRLVNLKKERLFTPVLEVYLDSLDQKRFTVDFRSTPPEQLQRAGAPWHIWRIRVHDPSCRMLSGIGIGSTYGELRRRYRISDKVRGEDAFYVIVSDLGMSFALSSWQEGSRDEAEIKSILLLKSNKQSAD